ncbi:Flavinator of succinate dehydrogenase [Candidatus Bealeia paramacronuclearis]|uniref:FAD assembly factor SdhE n=1 Tax=Candidatus Bealeia paramacronuclearis TaxID=1921001 RepID=A0ABZ2C759_9PROT|nr:Flavinator of succinate dehydrogenase [Candidatus Bealeia paramacronuclearis]
MENKQQHLIKKLLYVSQHRGMKESDVLIGGFARAHLHTMTIPELEAWEGLLQENDNDLIDWLFDRKPRPLGAHGGLLDRLYADVKDKLE